MTYFFHICISFFLVILQTTVIPYIPLFDKFYDLLCPFVIYLSIFRSAREGIPVILFIGFVMDNISGGIFGLYLTTYIWLFIGVRWIITFLHLNDSLLLPFVVAAGVLMENLIFIGTHAMFGTGTWRSSTVLDTIGVQVLWAVLTGPVLLIFFNYANRRWNRWIKGISIQKS